MFDNPYVRLILTALMPYIAFGIKSVGVNLARPWVADKLPLGRGSETLFDYKKQFRLLGWDFASSSLGLAVFAILYPKSALATLATSGNGVSPALLLAAVFFIFYFSAVIIRYLIQEDRERQFSKDQSSLRSRELVYTWSIVSWCVGIFCYCVAALCVTGFK